MTVLFERVKETIAERILVKSWLDDDTRTQALLKLNSLRGRFHVSRVFYNDTLLAREMAEVRRLHFHMYRIKRLPILNETFQFLSSVIMYKNT